MDVRQMIDEISSWDEAISLGCEIVTIESDWHYLLGELAQRLAGLESINADTSEKKTQTLRAFSKEIGQSYEVVKDAHRVAMHVDRDVRTRFQKCSFGHWREIVRSGIRGPGVERWAEEVESNSWSVSQLRKVLHDQDPDARVNVDWLAHTKRLSRLLGDMERYDLKEAWKHFATETGLVQRSLEVALKAIQVARDELVREVAGEHES